jgi:hypothetical protein
LLEKIALSLFHYKEDIMNITLRTVKAKLKKINLLTETGGPLPYSQFKNFVTIKEYGKKNRIVFSGTPKETLFGFYVSYDTYPNMLREAYEWYTRIVYGDLGPMHEKSVLIGNSGIPDEYEKIEWEN